MGKTPEKNAMTLEQVLMEDRGDCYSCKVIGLLLPPHNPRRRKKF